MFRILVTGGINVNLFKHIRHVSTISSDILKVIKMDVE